MNRQQFIDALFARAKEAGFEACEVYYSASDSFSTSVFKGEITEYSVSESLGLGFRGLFGGKMGYASLLLKKNVFFIHYTDCICML